MNQNFTNLLIYAALVKSVDDVPRFPALFEIVLAERPEDNTPNQHRDEQCHIMQLVHNSTTAGAEQLTRNVL